MPNGLRREYVLSSAMGGRDEGLVNVPRPGRGFPDDALGLLAPAGLSGAAPFGLRSRSVSAVRVSAA